MYLVLVQRTLVEKQWCFQSRRLSVCTQDDLHALSKFHSTCAARGKMQPVKANCICHLASEMAKWRQV